MKYLRIIMGLVLFTLPCLAEFGSGTGSFGTIGNGTLNGSFVNPTFLSTSGTNALIYVDAIYGNDANSGTSPQSAFQSISAALTSSYRFTNSIPTIVLAPGVTNYIPSSGFVFECTNQAFIAWGAFIYQTNNTGNNRIFDTYGNFYFYGGTIISTNVLQSYPFVMNSAVGQSNNVVHIEGVTCFDGSDFLATLGTTSGAKSYPYFEIVNCNAVSFFDTVSIALKGTNGLIRNCHFEVKQSSDLANLFGGGLVNHAIVAGPISPSVLTIENSTWVATGATNNIGLDNNNSGLIVVKNCNGRANAAAWTTNNWSIYNEGAGFISIEGWNGDGLILNAGSGSITNVNVITCLPTNGLPTGLVAPNGALITTTNGQIYIRTNGAWRASGL